MRPADRQRIEAEVTRRLTRALRAWYENVYRWVRFLRKQDNDQRVDWKLERATLLTAMAAAMLWAAEEAAIAEADYWAEQGLAFDADAQAIYDQYEIGAEGRLGAIAATTERSTRRAVDEWMGNEEPEQTLVEQINDWYDSARAKRIGETETAYLIAANTVYTMRRVGSNRWQWIHDGDDEPCALLCAPYVGGIFGMSDPMPPFSTHPYCHCYPWILVD